MDHTNAAVPSLISFVLLSLPIALGVYLFSRYWQLRHIPGPVLASLTNLYAAIRIWRGEYYHKFIQDLHRQYGPVVRWGPNRVSFSSPDAVSIIYGTQNVFPKAASYQPLIVLAKGEEIPTLVTIRDEKRLSAIKRHISAGFSQSTWLKQEEQIDGTLQKLIERLGKEDGKEVDLARWLRYWSFDTLTLVAFGESREYLKHESDIDAVFPASRERFEHWRLWSSTPWLEALVFKNRLVQFFQKSSSGLAQLAMKQVKIRQDLEKQSFGSVNESDLMGRYMAASHQAPDVVRMKDVLALTISTIHAGSETIAGACVGILGRTLANPEVHAKLAQEVEESGLSIPASFNEIDKLPFLDAVVREALRLQVNPNCTERTVSPIGIELCDTYIPAGTDVSISEALVARNADVYGKNPQDFIPQRWLDAAGDEKKFREMERASFHFSFGRRECIGKHLARIQMKKCVAAVIGSFKMEPAKQPEIGTNTSSALGLRVKLQKIA